MLCDDHDDMASFSNSNTRGVTQSDGSPSRRPKKRGFRYRKWPTTNQLDCVFIMHLIGYDLGHNDSRFILV